MAQDLLVLSIGSQLIPETGIAQHGDIVMPSSRPIAMLFVCALIVACSEPSEPSPPPVSLNAETARVAVQAHLQLLAVENVEGEADYQRSLQALRNSPAPALTALSEVYQKVPIDRRIERWNIVFSMADVGSEHAVIPLRKIALTLPAEELNEFEKENDAMIRLRAIEGLRILSLAGSSAADDSLRTCMRDGDVYARSAAAHAYLSGNRRSEARLADVRAHLPRDAQHLANLRDATQSDFTIEPPRFRRHKNPKRHTPAPSPSR